MSQIPETGLRLLALHLDVSWPHYTHRNEPDTGNGIETREHSGVFVAVAYGQDRNEPDTGNGIETRGRTTRTSWRFLPDRNEPDTGNGIETHHVEEQYPVSTANRNEPDTGNVIETRWFFTYHACFSLHRNEPDTGNGIETSFCHSFP